MKNKIPNELQYFIKNNTPLNASKLSDELKNFIGEYAIFYQWNLKDVNKIFRCMKKGIAELRKCGYKDCSNTVYFNCDLDITVGCCRDHSMKINNLKKYNCENVNQVTKFKEKSKRTNLKKYGFENPMQSQEVKEKVKKTNLELFGTEWAFENENIKQKIKNTNIQKYGVENVFSSDTFKETIKLSNLKNLGVEYPMQSEMVREKSKNTCMEIYGMEFAMQSDEVKEKLKQTNLERFGVENPMHSDEIKQKMTDNAIEKYGVRHHMHLSHVVEKQLKSMYKRKPYVWQTGEVSFVQGNEPIVLRELEEKGYSYQEVKTSPSDMPVIMYLFEDETHRYYPDIFIPKENTIIEVKSDYTLEKELDKNVAKFSATKELGYNFRLEIR